MSNDDKTTTPEVTPEDDGWGDANDEIAPSTDDKPLHEAETGVEDNEWGDPVNLEGRVAALEEGSELPTTVGSQELSQPSTDVATPLSAVVLVPPEIYQEPTADVDEGHIEVPSEGFNTSGQVPSETSDVTTGREPNADFGTTSGQVLQEQAQWGSPPEHESQEAASELLVADEDAPQWSRDDIELPAPSSDMLAAAGVLADKETPKTEKRRKKRVRGPKTQLTQRQQVIMIAGAAAVLGVGISALLGYFNSKHYYFVCDTDGIRAEKGDFWPWGQSPLSGTAFREIRIPKDALCTSREYESRGALEDAFLSALLEQTTTLLTSGNSEQVSEAEQQIEQALLLTRDPERSEGRNLAKRLQGDVLYWHGAAEIQRSIDSLNEAALQFEKAAAKRPRHSSDANPWAEHARYLQGELDKGPRSLRKDESPKEEPHFQGLSDPKPDTRPNLLIPDTGATVPVPDAESDAPDASENSSADGGINANRSFDAGLPAPDAGLPRGGVLL